MDELLLVSNEAIRAFVVVAIPLFFSVAFASLLGSIVQSSFQMSDSTVSYAFRVVALVAVISALSSSLISPLITLFKTVLQ